MPALSVRTQCFCSISIRTTSIFAVLAAASSFLLLDASGAWEASAQNVSAQDVSSAAKARRKAPEKKEEKKENEWEVDTNEIFGFTKGSDIGEVGEKEVEMDSVGVWGKQAGRYSVNSTKFEYSYVAAENFLIAPSISIGRYDISGVPGFDDRHRWALDGFAFEMKYRLLDRDKAPFGLTLVLEPRWGPVDRSSGAPADSYGLEFVAAADKELIKNRLYGGVNFIYEPGWTRQRDTGEWERDSTIGFAGALTTPLAPGFTVGMEARYFRAYEGAALNTFAGEALFVGPNFWVKLPNKLNLSAAWNAQVAGRAVDEPGRLDLTNFERHRARLRLSKEF